MTTLVEELPEQNLLKRKPEDELERPAKKRRVIRTPKEGTFIKLTGFSKELVDDLICSVQLMREKDAAFKEANLKIIQNDLIRLLPDAEEKKKNAKSIGKLTVKLKSF